MHRCGICIAIAILQRIGEVVFNILTADIHNVGISGIGPRPIRPNGQRAILGINRDTIDRVNNRADHRAATFRRIGDGRDGRTIGIRPDRVIICQQIAGDRIAGRIPRLIQAVFAIILGIRHIVLNIDLDVALCDRAIAIGRNQGKGNIFDQIGALSGRMVQIAQQVKLIAVAICWIARQRHRENGLCPRQCGNRRSVGGQRIGQGHAIRRETHILQRRWNFQHQRVAGCRAILPKVDSNRPGYTGFEGWIGTGDTITGFQAQIGFINQAIAHGLRAAIGWEGNLWSIIANSD